MSDTINAARITAVGAIIAAVAGAWIQRGCDKPAADKAQGPTPSAISTAGKIFGGDWVEQFFQGAKGRGFHWFIQVDSGKVEGHTLDTGGVEHSLVGNVTSETTFKGHVRRTRPGSPGDVAEGEVQAHIVPSGFEWQLTWTKSSQGDEVKVGDSEKSEFWKRQ